MAVGDPFILNPAASGTQFMHEVVALDRGGFVVIYAAGVDTAEGIFAQKYDSLGNRIGSELAISDSDSEAIADSLSATLMADGRIFVSWSQRKDEVTGVDVVSQIIDPRDGSVFGTAAEDTLYGSHANDAIIAAGSTDLVYALEGNDHAKGGADDDTLYGGLGHDTLDGGAGDDLLIGSYGHDVLLGGPGVDTLRGGNGNDFYDVDSALDVIEETGGLEDFDTVRSTFSFSLMGHAIEELILTGTAATGTGNSMDNEITGNEGDNTLSGDGGMDTLSGEGGNDSLLGGADNDLLDGGDGNDTLDGGTGADTMRGGDGNDTYIVDNLGDMVDEAGGGGTDTVRSTVDFTLGADLDNLVMLGSAVTGRGNTLGNTINGNGNGNVIFGDDGGDTISGGGGSDAIRGEGGGDYIEGGYGNDFIDGGTGDDTMKGQNGNDTYVVDSASDVIDETGGVGDVDTVRSFVSFNLSGEPLENLELQGAAPINGTGNSLNNMLTGNGAGNALSGGAGMDTLNGGGGKDSLTGGSGTDQFVFSSAADIGSTNATRDAIFDFSQAQNDRIDLSALDAIPGGADDAFTFIGAGAAFSNTAGELRSVAEGGNTRIEGDIDGDGTADFQMILIGSIAMTGGDFIL